MESTFTTVPRFDNLQNELRRELAPQGFLEEEVFAVVVAAARARRLGGPGRNHANNRAFFAALREFQRLQDRREPALNEPPPSINVINFPGPRSVLRRRPTLPASA